MTEDSHGCSSDRLIWPDACCYGYFVSDQILGSIITVTIFSRISSEMQGAKDIDGAEVEIGQCCGFGP